MPAVAHAAAQNGDNFGVTRHLGGEEDDADKDEQRTVQVDKAWDEVEIVVHHNLFEGGVVA